MFNDSELDIENESNTNIEGFAELSSDKNESKDTSTDDVNNLTELKLSGNRIVKQSTLFTENVNVLITQNIFNVKEVTNIGTIVAPEAVEITENAFEDNKQVKFASDEYLDVVLSLIHI